MAKITAGQSGTRPYIVLEVTQSSQSIPNNTTTIAYKWILKRPSEIKSTATKSGYITINGERINWSGSIGGIGDKILLSGTRTIAHNADGTKSITFNQSLTLSITWSGVSLGTISNSGTMTFTKIPRASSFGTITGSTIGSSILIGITRASSSFTHTLTYKFGSTSGTIGTGLGTSVSWIPPMTLCNQVPNATSGACTLSLTTYNGSTKIGSTVTKNITLGVPGTIVPSVTSFSVQEGTENLASKFGLYIRNKSKIKVSIGATGSYGSSIKAYSTKISGNMATQTIPGSSFTSGIVSSYGTVEITTTITDSRGRSVLKGTTIKVTDYVAPKITEFKVQRCHSDGSLNEEGIYAKLTYSYAITSLSSKNTNTYQLQYLNGSTWETLQTGVGYHASSETYTTTKTFSKDKTTQFRIVVRDYFSTINSQGSIEPTFSLINFSQEGRGLAFGTVAEKDKLVTNLYSYLSKNVYMRDHLFVGASKNSVTDGKAGVAIVPNGTIELTAPTPFIDFHYGNSTTDYTSRILESANGQLDINKVKFSNAKIIMQNESNGGIIQCYDLNGVLRNLLGYSPSGNTALGYGNYEKASGSTNIYAGDIVGLLIKDSTGSQNGVACKRANSNIYPYKAYFEPKGNGTMTLGTSANRWYRNYVTIAENVSSDKRLKTNIEDIDEKYIKLFNKLNPKKYSLLENEREGINLGFIAQDVEKAMLEVGLVHDELSLLEHAFWIDEETNEEKERYSLSYTQFIPLLTKVIQSLQEEVEELKCTLKSIREE